MDAKTYNKRSNAQRAAKSALGATAEEGKEFTTVKNDDGLWAWLKAGGLDEPTSQTPSAKVEPAATPPAAAPALAPAPDTPPAAYETLDDMLAAHAEIAPLLRLAYEIGAATRKAPRRAPTARTGPTKREQAAALLTQDGGATAKEILALTGWPAVSIPALAKASGLTLTKTKDGSTTRYYGKAA